jgi:tetratricopeptide (TPR) repeat protein
MTHIENAQQYFKNSQFNKAIDEYEKALIENPNDALVLQGLGLCFLKTNHLDDAISACLKAIELNAKLTTPLILLGTIYLGRNKLEDAERNVQKALSLDSNQKDAYFLLGGIYLKRDQIQESISYLRKTITLDPQYWKAHLNLGLVYNRQNLRREALKEFWLAFKIAPSMKTASAVIVEYINIYGFWYAIAGGILIWIALTIHSVFAWPLVLIVVAYFLFGSYRMLRGRNYLKSIAGFLMGVLIIVLYILFTYVFPPVFRK